MARPRALEPGDLAFHAHLGERLSKVSRAARGSR